MVIITHNNNKGLVILAIILQKQKKINQEILRVFCSTSLMLTLIKQGLTHQQRNIGHIGDHPT